MYGWRGTSKLVISLYRENSPLLILIPHICLGYMFLTIILSGFTTKLTMILFDYLGGLIP